MRDDVAAYIDAIGSDRRALFDRVHRLIMDVQPDADVVLSYKMPTYVAGGRRLYVAVWKHGSPSTGGSTAETEGLPQVIQSSTAARARSSCRSPSPCTSATPNFATSWLLCSRRSTACAEGGYVMLLCLPAAP